uniref:Band 7 domain-containing protein n=1 Tax=Plectus sambesii TaxID=2011161 RepID=A0A914XHL1_9BILA
MSRSYGGGDSSSPRSITVYISSEDDDGAGEIGETHIFEPPSNIETNFGVCGWILTVLSYILICLTLPISACMCVKVVQEYERAVIFRLGRLMPGGAKGPGIFFIVPCIDTYRKVDLRVVSFDVPPQERVEVKDVRLPVQLQRAMAAEAEAAREARAKVIAAEGEQKASRALKEAADVISQSPSALQLRYLQTLNSISAEKNSTIIFPLPIDLLSAFLPRQSAKVAKSHADSS